MKLQNIKEHLLAELAKEECLQGYKVSKKDFAFKMKIKDVELKIIFTNNNWIDEIHLIPWVCIKVKAIHEMCEKFGFDLNYTAYINLFILEKVVKGEFNKSTRRKLQYDLKDCFVLFSEDITEVMIKMKELLMYAMDYIKKNSTIEAIDKLYNEDPTYKYNPHCAGMQCHCIVGLVAAKLSNNPNFKQIAEIYSHIMNDNPDDFLPKDIESFNRIKAYLTNL